MYAEAAPPTWCARVAFPQLRDDLRCIDDLHAWPKASGDRVPLGVADENEDAADDTVEA